MSIETNTGAIGLLSPVDRSADPPQVLDLLSRSRAILINDFPVDPEILIEYLGALGEPCGEYARFISGEAASGMGLGINVVKLGAERGGRTHRRGGELAPHTARSWARDRPRFFSMLMVEPGWRDRPRGNNGESVFVPWSLVMRTMRATDPGRFRSAFTLLSRTNVTFEADHVREPVSALPLVYPLPGARDELDFGVRLKQDLADVLRRNGESPALAEAVEWLQAVARELGFVNMVALQKGDLVILDNNRWAHGRFGFEIQRNQVLNPREVWSLTLK